MTFTVAIARNGQYLRVDVTGPASLGNFVALATQVGAHIEGSAVDRALFDLRQVQGRLTTSEQQLVGEVAANRLTRLSRLASIVPRGEITRNSERTAVGKGLQMRVFDSETGALDWLLEG